MSGSPAEKLRRPEDLSVPTHDKVNEMIESFTPEGMKEFVREIWIALALAKENGDLRHVNLVIDAWYRTLLFHDSGYEARWDAAQEGPQGAALDADEIREHLKI